MTTPSPATLTVRRPRPAADVHPAERRTARQQHSYQRPRFARRPLTSPDPPAPNGEGLSLITAARELTSITTHERDAEDAAVLRRTLAAVLDWHKANPDYASLPASQFAVALYAVASRYLKEQPGTFARRGSTARAAAMVVAAAHSRSLA